MEETRTSLTIYESEVIEAQRALDTKIHSVERERIKEIEANLLSLETAQQDLQDIDANDEAVQTAIMLLRAEEESLKRRLANAKASLGADDEQAVADDQQISNNDNGDAAEVIGDRNNDEANGEGHSALQQEEASIPQEVGGTVVEELPVSALEAMLEDAIAREGKFTCYSD